MIKFFFKYLKIFLIYISLLLLIVFMVRYDDADEKSRLDKYIFAFPILIITFYFVIDTVRYFKNRT